jgi:hypothetical protein
VPTQDLEQALVGAGLRQHHDRDEERDDFCEGAQVMRHA